MVGGFMPGFSLVPRSLRLWHAGSSWRDVLSRPPAPDAADARLGLAAGAKPAELPPATSGEFGRQTGAVQQARNDRRAILKILERVPKSEKKLLPDVLHTVDALLHRAEELARMLHTMSADVDQSALARLDAKIAATKQEPEGAERERQLGLLARQRQTLTDLVTRRQLIEDQVESCVLAMQNVRFDLLRLRSAGVAAVLDDLTQATQQARAPSRDVDHAIAAAGGVPGAAGGPPTGFSVRPRLERIPKARAASRSVPRTRAHMERSSATLHRLSRAAKVASAARVSALSAPPASARASRRRARSACPRFAATSPASSAASALRGTNRARAVSANVVSPAPRRMAAAWTVQKGSSGRWRRAAST